MGKLLKTPKELAERVGIPVSNVRYLIREDMLDHIFTAPGKRKGTPLLRVKRYDKFERIAQDQRRRKTSRVERIPATRDWVEAFCAAADPHNAAVLRFMFETAARIDQAISIEPEDLRPQSCEVRIKAQKRYPEGWITVSPQMMAELVALKPKQPKNLKTGQLLSPRVFGYGSSTGYNNRWKTICKRAGIPYLSAHPAGRHGFFTELVVRQGVDPVTAAKAGRWSDPNLPMRIYAHAETDEVEVRARFRTNLVQDAGEKRPCFLLRGRLQVQILPGSPIY